MRDLPEVVAHFVSAPLDRSDVDEMTLAAVAHHYLCTDAVSREPNVLVLHYANMRKDPHAAIRQIADHLDIPVSRGTADRIAEATSFSNMKANADRFAPHASDGILHDAAAFFDSGQSNKFAGKISAAQLAEFEAALNRRLSPAAARWLLNGGERPA